jgi:dTDP-glucose pyrophosphorylase/transcriptional regulator with XRE-family HTH domain
MFAQELKKYRQATGLSRQKLADLVGLDSSYVFRIESESRHPSRRTVLSMAEALGLDGETVNEWLIAAGHGPIPLLPETGPATPSKKGKSESRNQGAASGTKAARRGKWLERIGFEEPVLARLMKSMETATASERLRMGAVLSQTMRRMADNLESPIRKVVIPVAGDKHRLVGPFILQRLLIRAIGEAIECGIQEVILVLAPGTQDAFYSPVKDMFVATAPQLTLTYCIQPEPRGLGSAILEAAKPVGENPFAVILPDDVLDPGPRRAADLRELKYMIDAWHEAAATNLVAVTSVSRRKMPKYGIVEVSNAATGEQTLPIKRLIEKPDPDHAIVKSPNALSIVGRYILQPSILSALRELMKQQPAKLELTAALELLRKTNHEIRAFPVKGLRRDFGEVIDQAHDFIEESAL